MILTIFRLPAGYQKGHLECRGFHLADCWQWVCSNSSRLTGIADSHTYPSVPFYVYLLLCALFFAFRPFVSYRLWFLESRYITAFRAGHVPEFHIVPLIVIGFFYVFPLILELAATSTAFSQKDGISVLLAVSDYPFHSLKCLMFFKVSVVKNYLITGG